MGGIDWTGTSHLSRRVGGRYGGDVVFGNVRVPRHAVFDWVGDLGHPDMHVEFEWRDDRPVCVEFRITAKPDGRGIRTIDLREFSIDKLASNLYSHLAVEVREGDKGIVVGRTLSEEAFWKARNGVEKAITSPGRGVSEGDLQRVAQIYRDNIDGSPVLAVQHELGLKSARTAARRIQEARKAGHLPATTPGKRKG